MKYTYQNSLNIQQNINKLIKAKVLNIVPLVEDGIIGAKTINAIKKVQSFFDLPVNGEYNFQTELKIASKLGNKFKSIANNNNNNNNTKLKVNSLKGTDNKTLVLKEAITSNITDKNELAMLLAHLHHESSGFTRLEENFNYRPDRLLAVFPRYVKGIEDVRILVASGAKAIADRVYGNRMGNGPDEGYKYRGRGFIQLTGKNNYRLYSQLTKLDLLNKPDLLLDPVNAAIVSVAYWNNTKGLKQAAQKGDVETTTKIINGGLNGLADRKQLYKRYLKEV